MKRGIGTLLLLLAVTIWAPCRAAEAGEDEDFVIASLLVASPGDVLYSCVGHACLRMQCPEHGLDYCFSYEGEPVEHQIPRFFAGRLKMGMYAVPTKDYLPFFANDKRGVKQYRLNLPLEAKRRLWEILDNRAMEGADLSYDYLKHGCAQTIIQFLVQSLDTIPIQFAPWTEKYDKTRRELLASRISAYPWNRITLYTLVGNEADDTDCSQLERVVTPLDLLEVLQGATVNGGPIISEAPVQLLPEGKSVGRTWFTPMLLAILLLWLSLANFWLRWPFADWLLLGLQFLLGLFLCYLVFVSDLPCTEWNWLLIPFNPLPLLLWRWHRRWALAFAAILVGWLLVMCFYPHQLTDWAYVVLATALVPVFCRQRNK